ncbi:amino acid transporter [Schizophyllum commune H4-8]|uniref:amino acid transporter n=1 Tax=Schizophyllum commune (strain H4-8 / FGSC 9210) TaxID=578458 RepID=UPI002160FA40|nr:amino acid transporter [Schizophyllum commune H4-8]KAI5888051.1 amino acid transporter [Schizophyllum commune H4-8]
MSVEKAGSIQIDDAVAIHDLKELGYEQELVRSRGLPHILFTCGLAAPIATSLVGGGPASMFWGLLVVSLFTLAVALSLAEIASKYPTSGGAYYWTYQLAPRRYRLVLSYITGWLIVTGDWMLALSAAFGTAQFFVAGVGIYHPEWEATAWQTYLIFLGILLVIGIFCIFFNQYLPLLEIISACWIVLGLIALLISLSVRAQAGRHSAEFAFTHFDASFSGWPAGWTFFIGLFPAGYTFSGVGMIASMAEEVHKPALNVPRAMVWSVPIGWLMGVVFILPINFTLPDVAELLQVSSVQPIAVISTMVMGSKGGGFGMWFIIFGIALFCSISINCAASRATWSFARDKGLPFHATFAEITLVGTASSSSNDLPLNALLLSLAIQALLGLIHLGSSAAFNAFVGVEVMCLGASYAIPIIAVMVGARGGVEDATYSLGKWGWACNIIAVLWVALEMVLFSMPAVLPVEKETMIVDYRPAADERYADYASVVFVGFAAISAGWYMINGRFHYAGPPVAKQLEADD